MPVVLGHKVHSMKRWHSDKVLLFYKDRDTKMPSVLMPIEYKGGEEAGAIICLSKPQCFSDIYMFLGSLYVPRICLSFGG